MVRFNSILFLYGHEISKSQLDTHCPITHQTILAADGAYQLCKKNDITVDWVIGDGDSLKRAPDSPTRIYTDTSQDTTDFEKSLAWIKQHDLFPTCVIGLVGAEMDHSLKNLYILADWGQQYPIVACQFTHCQQVCFALPPTLKCQVQCKQTISILPITPMQVNTTGLLWELNHAKLSPCDQTSVRNRTTTSQLSIHSEGRGLLTLNDCTADCDAVKQYIHSFTNSRS